MEIERTSKMASLNKCANLKDTLSCCSRQNTRRSCPTVCHKWHIYSNKSALSSHQYNSRISRKSVYQVYVFAVFLLLSICVHPSCAAPKQSTEVEEDSDLLNYYYHSNDNNYGMAEYVSDWSQEWAKMSGRMPQPKCVDIPENLTLCANIGYKEMMLPNLLNHDSIKEVVQQARSWIPLARIDCHPDTSVFLCSLFTPICLDRPGQSIYPCRSLCEGVRQSCESRMQSHGFDWPEMLKCDKFPLDHDMCIRPIHDVKPDNNCTACKHAQTHEALIDHYCRADIAMRVTLKGQKPFKEEGPINDMELLLRKKRKIYKYTNMEKKEARSLPVVLRDGVHCKCQTLNGTQKYLVIGSKRNDRIEVKFVMVWKRKDREFRKGLRAIRKGDCKELLKTVIDGATDENEKEQPLKKDRNRRKKKGRKGRKGNKKDRKGKKGRRRKGKKGRKGRRKNGKRNKKTDSGGNKMKKRDNAMSKSEIEDRTLNNLMNAAATTN